MLAYAINAETTRTCPSRETMLKNIPECIYALQMVELMLDQNYNATRGTEFGLESRNLMEYASTLETALHNYFDRWNGGERK